MREAQPGEAERTVRRGRRASSAAVFWDHGDHPHTTTGAVGWPSDGRGCGGLCWCAVGWALWLEGLQCYPYPCRLCYRYLCRLLPLCVTVTVFFPVTVTGNLADYVTITDTIAVAIAGIVTATFTGAVAVAATLAVDVSVDVSVTLADAVAVAVPLAVAVTHAVYATDTVIIAASVTAILDDTVTFAVTVFLPLLFVLPFSFSLPLVLPAPLPLLLPLPSPIPLPLPLPLPLPVPLPVPLPSKGYALRELKDDFLKKYKVLQPEAKDLETLVAYLSNMLGASQRDWQIGTSKVPYKSYIPYHMLSHAMIWYDAR